MPRRLRTCLRLAPLHVVHRGNNRVSCFSDDRDRLVYLALLSNGARREQCDVHAYVLMTNHVHLLVTPNVQGSASRLMKSIGEAYVRWFNRKYERSGTLWEGRFHSSLIDTERYLLSCYRYIELNPVRAGIVGRPEEYAWSSHRVNALGEPCPWLTPHPVYLSLHSSADKRMALYRAQFAAAEPADELKEIRDAINGSFALGTPDFIARMELATGRRLARRTPGRRPKVAMDPDPAGQVSLFDKGGLTPISPKV